MDAHELEIEIEITRDGTVHCRVRGAKGKACLEYARLIAETVGRLETQELTEEYHERDVEVHLKPVVRVRRR